MPRTRTYTTDHGHAHATYDGSAWYVEAHPANDPAYRDEACPLGGHSLVNGLSVTTYRDEGSFRGRQWLVEGPGGAAIPDGDNDMGAGYASLRSVAETAIHVAYDRLRLEDLKRGLTPEGAPELVTSHPFSVHSRRPVCRVCKRAAGEHAMTEEGVSEASYWTRAQRAAGRVIFNEPGSLPYVVARDLPADDAEADAAIDDIANTTHAGQFGGYEDDADHERVIAALQTLDSVEEAYDVNTGGHVYVVEARVEGIVDTEGRSLEVVGQTSVQADDEGVERWLMGVEFRTQMDVLHGFNVIPKPGQAPERGALASGIARDLLAVIDACGKGQPDGRGLPDWVDGLERYTAGEPHVVERVDTIDLTPGNEEQANILTMLAEQFARQGMVPNAFGAMASVLDLARCLQANAPDTLQGVIDRLQQDEAQWGPDTPAGKAAAHRAGDDW